jgi:hypothetical protein
MYMIVAELNFNNVGYIATGSQFKWTCTQAWLHVHVSIDYISYKINK